MAMLRTPRVAIALLIACLPILGCDSLTAPFGRTQRIAVADTIAGTVKDDSSQNYSFIASLGTEYAVLLDVTTGGAVLTVSDSLSGNVLGGVSADASQGEAQMWTANFVRPGVVLISIRNSYQAAKTSYRLFVYAVNRAPESRSSRFTVGDTVADAIDAVPDVDTFVTRGAAGQDLVGWIEALANQQPAINITVIDPASGNQLASTFDNFGDTNPRLAVLPPLPAAGDYTFRVPPFRPPGYPQYTGPYRFRFYQINRAPETIAAAIPAGSVVSGERLDVGGDIDEYTFAAAAGEQFNAFIRSSAGFPISLQALGPLAGGTPTITDPADTSLFRHGTGRFKALSAGDLKLRVTGPALRNSVGPYELYLYRVDPNPETAPATLTAGDTVSTESIDLPGDVDEFTFSGSAGDQFNLFFSPIDPVESPGMTASVRTASDSLIATIESSNPPSDFLMVSTGRFVLPTSGTYHVRVDGAAGRYRIFLYAVNPNPETLPKPFTFGDSLRGEAIDVPGDVDEFSVTVAESSFANLVLSLGNDVTPGTVDATLMRAGTGEAVALIGTSGSGSVVASGRFVLTPGSYVLRVLNLDGASPSKGSYEIRLYKFQAAPEKVSSTLVLGDTITAETLDPPGDFDDFVFSATRQDHINIALQGLGTASANGIRAFLTDSGGGLPIALVSSPSIAGSLDDHQSTRIDVPRDGTYRIMVSGGGDLPVPPQSYRLAVTRVPSAPEHTSSALAPGDSVLAEAIDFPGDIDVYSLTGAPGQHVAVEFQAPATNNPPVLVVIDPATGNALASEVGQGARLIPDVQIPTGGELKIAVYEPQPAGLRECFDATCGGLYRYTGPFTLRVMPVNLAPENVPSTYVVGDTVRGEAINPVADIDEFTVTASPGQQLSVWWRLTADPVPQGSLFQLRALDPSTGTALGGGNQALSGANANFIEWFSFTVPASGQFVIRVQGYDPGASMGVAPYEFFIR